MDITEKDIKLLVTKIVQRMESEMQSVGVSGFLKIGVFKTIDDAVKNAKTAFIEFEKIGLDKRKKIIENIRSYMRHYNEELAKLAVSETGLGNVSDKIKKNSLVIEKTPGVEYLESACFSGDNGLTLVEMAPYGVIGSITPSTNPAATIINNSISMLSAGNVVVFNPHPGAKEVSLFTVSLINKAIIESGGPGNLISTVEEPTLETSKELMTHPDIRLLVVTGGPVVVKTAMASGKKVIAAGPGNPPVVVDETADISKAALDIVTGASFDNNIVCIVEKEVFVVDKVCDELKREMAKQNAFQLTFSELDRVTSVLFKTENNKTHINRKYIGKDAILIAKDAGITVPKETRLLFAEVGFEHPLVQQEQLLPVLPLVRAKDWEDAINKAIITEHGYRHTSVMHSKNIERLSIMARRTNTSIFVKNGPSLAGLGYGGEGYTSMTIASPTGEGITTARTFTRQRRCVIVDYFRIV